MKHSGERKEELTPLTDEIITSKPVAGFGKNRRQTSLGMLRVAIVPKSKVFLRN
jgi:hypothetical protein